MKEIEYTIDTLRRNEDSPRFREEQRSFYPLDIPTLNPHDHNVFNLSQKGTWSVDGKGMALFLRSNRFVSTPDDRYYWFNGSYYQEVSDNDMLDAMTKAIITEPAVKMLSRTAKKDIISEWSSLSRVTDMDLPESFLTDPRYDGWLIPFENGLYNVTRDELVPFTPYMFFTGLLHTDFKPLDYHPVEEIYRSIIPDDATRDMFFLALGYTLYAEDLTPPAAFVLLGPGETGKSALLRVMRCILGDDNVVDMNPYELSGEYSTAELVGKKANLCTEGGKKPYSKIPVDGNRIKALVAGEPLTVNRKYKDRVTFRNTAKMWFAANSMPDLGDTSSGALRRVHIFPCLEKQDPGAMIYDMLCAPDALAYAAFRGLKAYLTFLIDGKNEFYDTPFMMEFKNDMRDSDSILDFIYEKYSGFDKEEISEELDGCIVTTLYNEYQDFVSDTGRVRAAPRKDFIEKIKLEFGMTKAKDNVWRADGLRSSAMVFKRR